MFTSTSPKPTCTSGDSELTRKKFEELRSKYPDRLPVVVVPEKTIRMAKRKLLVPADLSAAQLLYRIRKNISDVQPSEALFLSCNKRTYAAGTLVQEIWEKSRDEATGFLFVHVSKENVFG